jgi:hypothetical protein
MRLVGWSVDSRYRSVRRVALGFVELVGTRFGKSATRSAVGQGLMRPAVIQGRPIWTRLSSQQLDHSARPRNTTSREKVGNDTKSCRCLGPNLESVSPDQLGASRLVGGRVRCR